MLKDLVIGTAREGALCPCGVQCSVAERAPARCHAALRSPIFAYMLCRLCFITAYWEASQGWDAMQVRVWRIGESQDLMASMKGHKAAVTGLRLTRGDAEVVSAGADGCCIVWDLHTFVRRTSLVGQLFASVAYHPDESQLVTVGAR